MNLPRRENPAGSVGLPFNKRNVEEWSRLDRLTGIMETAKIETDHWAARSNNAAHKYGKVSITLLLICQMGSLIWIYLTLIFFFFFFSLLRIFKIYFYFFFYKRNDSITVRFFFLCGFLFIFELEVINIV